MIPSKYFFKIICLQLSQQINAFQIMLVLFCHAHELSTKVMSRKVVMLYRKKTSRLSRSTYTFIQNKNEHQSITVTRQLDPNITRTVY